MILSSEELEILEYLKGWSGKSVPVLEICKRAGGRKRFEESPNWARGLVHRLVEAKLINVNERGHYSFIQDATAAQPSGETEPASVQGSSSPLVDGNYFPGALPVEEPESKPERFISPEIAALLKKSGKYFII